MDLRRYIQGNRKGKEANRLEREAMNDPFLADALEGYEQLDIPPVNRISDIRRGIRTRSKRRHKFIRNFSIAASLLVCVGLGTYFLFQTSKRTPHEQIAQSESAIAVEESVVTIQAPQEQEKAVMRQRQEVSPPAPVSPPVIISEDLQIIEDEIEEESSEQSSEQSEVQIAEAPLELASASIIKGRVVDEVGEPLIGATITTQSQKQTVTDFDGLFALEAADKETLNVDYIGMESIILPADTGKDMLIAMHEDDTPLDEVVVIAYGVQKKELRKPLETPRPLIGKKEYKKYIEEHLIRPTDDSCKDIRGKVTVLFYIDADGNPYDLRVKKPLCPSADNEAIRLIEEGPLWSTGEKEVNITVKF